MLFFKLSWEKHILEMMSNVFEHQIHQTHLQPFQFPIPNGKQRKVLREDDEVVYELTADDEWAVEELLGF